MGVTAVWVRADVSVHDMSMQVCPACFQLKCCNVVSLCHAFMPCHVMYS